MKAEAGSDAGTPITDPVSLEDPRQLTILRPMSPPRWPPTPTAWGLSLLGAALFIVGTLMLWRGLMVMLGVRAVSPGGGEFFMALFVGAPTMLLAIGLLTVASAREGWKSLMSLAFLWLSIGFSVTWLAAMMVRR